MGDFSEVLWRFGDHECHYAVVKFRTPDEFWEMGRARESRVSKTNRFRWRRCWWMVNGEWWCWWRSEHPKVLSVQKLEARRSLWHSHRRVTPKSPPCHPKVTAGSPQSHPRGHPKVIGMRFFIVPLVVFSNSGKHRRKGSKKKVHWSNTLSRTIGGWRLFQGGQIRVKRVTCPPGECISEYCLLNANHKIVS